MTYMHFQSTGFTHMIIYYLHATSQITIFFPPLHLLKKISCTVGLDTLEDMVVLLLPGKNSIYEGPDVLPGWANYFEDLGKPSPSNSYDNDNFVRVCSEYSRLADCPPSNTFQFSTSYYNDAVQSLKLEKAVGPDGIEAEHILYSGPVVSQHLLDIFNAIISSCHIPEIFNLGFVIPIPKGKDKDQRIPANYRGISLLFNLAKLFEKLLLSKILEEGITINPLQGGFRVGYSCLHSAFILQEGIQSIRDAGKKAYVAFLDANKAFDTVWHQGLFVKLHQKGICHRIWHILNSWYSHSSSSVLLNGAASKPFPILQGVRQGAILSPLLYSVYVDELLDLLKESGLGAYVGTCCIAAPMYADDLALVADSASTLQSLLDIVSE